MLRACCQFAPHSGLCRRYRKLGHAGKLKTVITAAIARELSGFVWAIAKQTKARSWTFHAMSWTGLLNFS